MKNIKTISAVALSLLIAVCFIVPQSMTVTHAAGETVTVNLEGYGNNPVKVYTEGVNFDAGGPVVAFDDEIDSLDEDYTPSAKYGTGIPESYFDSSASEFVSGKESHGYTLKYMVGNEEFDFMETNITSSVEVTGVFVKKPIYVNIDMDGAAGNAEYELTEGESFSDAGITLPANPTKEGYRFKGWLKLIADANGNIEEDAGVPYTYNADFVPQDSMTILAKWELIDETIAVVYTPSKWCTSSFSGTCKFTKRWKHNPAHFRVSGFNATNDAYDHILKGKALELVCIDPNLQASPSYPRSGKFKATYQASGSDPLKGIYKYKIIADPKGNYQRGKGTIKVKSQPATQLTIRKVSSKPVITENNPCYDLAGAVFTIKDKNETVVKTLTTKLEGGVYVTDPVELAPGTYTITETTFPKGYALPTGGTATRTVILQDGKAYTEAFENVPKGDPVTAGINTKVDSETGLSTPAPGTTLEGGIFQVDYYKGYLTKDTLTTPSRTWYMKTDANGKTELNKTYLTSFEGKESDVLYLNTEGQPIIPLGTITVKEVKAPDGYYLPTADQTNFRLFQITEAGEANETIQVYNPYNQSEDVIRQNFKFTKVRDTSNSGLENVPFILSLYDTDENGEVKLDEQGNKIIKESHLIITGGGGIYDSDKENHSYRTNANDIALDKNTMKVDFSKLPSNPNEVGLWFKGSGTEEAIDDNNGSMLHGVYNLKEVRCAANEGLNLYDQDFSINHSETKPKDIYKADLGTITNYEVKIARTTAMEINSKKQVAYATKDLKLTDIVEYKGFTEGEKYTIVGTIMDKDSGEPVIENDKEVTGKTTFTCTYTNDKINVDFTVNAKELAGKRLVLFEEVYNGTDTNAEPITEHKDLGDENQTITLANPDVGTTLTDATSGKQVALAGKDTCLKDTVSYKGVIPNLPLELTGTLMDTDGNPLKDTSGKEITSTVKFTPSKESGTQDVLFKFNAEALAGYSGTAFEVLKYADEQIASHEDINDTKQKVIFPEIKTQAFDAADDDKKIENKEHKTIKDIVTYKNVVPGQEYYLTAALVDKMTGKSIANGKATFTAETSEGEQPVEITFNASKYNGKNVVVFESLWSGKDKIASHDELTDADQTVAISIPGVPKTGDNNLMIILLLGLMIICGITAIVLSKKNKKDK